MNDLCELTSETNSLERDAETESKPETCLVS